MVHAGMQRKRAMTRLVESEKPDRMFAIASIIAVQVAIFLARIVIVPNVAEIAAETAMTTPNASRLMVKKKTPRYSIRILIAPNPLFNKCVWNIFKPYKRIDSIVVSQQLELVARVRNLLEKIHSLMIIKVDSKLDDKIRSSYVKNVVNL